MINDVQVPIEARKNGSDLIERSEPRGLMVGITYCFVKPFVAAHGIENCLYS